MNPERDPKFYDDLLDAALAGYNAEPRPGLERRVLAGVRAGQAHRGFWLQWQWAAVAAAAVVVLAAGLYVLRRPAPQTTARVLPAVPVSAENVNRVARPGDATAAQVTPLVPGTPRVSRIPRVAAVRTVEMAAAPRLAVFPTPRPPSAQERALARVVATTDPQVLQALAAASQAPTQELVISELKVEPLPSANDDAPPRPRN